MLYLLFIGSDSLYGQILTSNSQHNDGKYSIDSLFVALLTNGDASIDYNLAINSNEPSINITFFGQSLQNLTLTDYNGTQIRFVPTETPNKVTVYSQTSSDIHVTYTTSDLVDKQNRNWTFSFFFPDRFLLKMPSQAHIVEMQPPPFLTPTDDQNLWGFGPGNVQVDYIIGPLGTREEAQASIRNLEESIKDVKSNYENILLYNTTNLLENAKSNFKQGKYLETVTYAKNSLSLLQDTVQNYVLAQESILQAETEIQNLRISNLDTLQAEETLSKARTLFLGGQYKNAQNAAIQSINQSEVNSASITNPDVYVIIGIFAVIVTMTAAVIFVVKKSKNSRIITLGRKTTDNPLNNESHVSGENSNTNLFSEKGTDASPIHFELPTDSTNDGIEMKNYLKKVVEEVGNVKKDREKQEKYPVTLSSLEEHVIDKETLLKTVSQMKTEKPHLKNEDKQLLDYLCEKQGSAFESEVRNRFIMPRTSLWRLIKRLEREDLVEVRKIGGQNLIKLRFEVKSP
jgi:uncharacterized membrane protein